MRHESLVLVATTANVAAAAAAVANRWDRGTGLKATVVHKRISFVDHALDTYKMNKHKLHEIASVSKEKYFLTSNTSDL